MMMKLPLLLVVVVVLQLTLPSPVVSEWDTLKCVMCPDCDDDIPLPRFCPEGTVNCAKTVTQFPNGTEYTVRECGPQPKESTKCPFKKIPCDKHFCETDGCNSAPTSSSPHHVLLSLGLGLLHHLVVASTNHPMCFEHS